MKFRVAIRTCIKKALNSSDDRASRSEYWWFAAFSFAVSFLGFSFFFEFLPDPKTEATSTTSGFSVVMLIFSGSILFLVLASALTVLFSALTRAGERRLNDISALKVGEQWNIPTFLRKRKLSAHQKRFISTKMEMRKSFASLIAACMIMGMYPLILADVGKAIETFFPVNLLIPFIVLPAMLLSPFGLILIIGSVPFFFLAKRSTEYENKYGPNPSEVST